MGNNNEFKKPLLSICIPTYNRAEQIQRQVRSLLPQLNDYIKLVIIDNCSLIPIETLFDDLELCRFTIIRNKINIGGDANIIRCHELCTTEWLWTLSDDDFVKEDAVSQILGLINKSSSDTILINIDTNDNKCIESKSDFFKGLIDPISLSNLFWISKCVYHESKLREGIVFYYNSLSSMMGQLGYIMYSIINNPSFKIIKSDYNIFQYKNQGGWVFEKFVWRNWILYIISKTQFDEAHIEYLGRGIAKYNLTFINERCPNYKQLIYLNLNRYGFYKLLFYHPNFLLKKIALLILPKWMIIFFRNNVLK